ncbi:GntR family transcriptional regulator [Brevibacterium album]|uniref:GntR family transcriptional regulator n=1 Tax=Brevibacterium album TaxID=417948 RepID=UPI0004297D26|nr:GntR family transcriptional regulator [Brevibacterium album]
MTPDDLEQDSEASRVTRHLREQILDGVRAPGSRLVERSLAEELAVSRVPVRDALRALAAEGLVTLRPRTWATVRVLSPDDIADLMEVRRIWEARAFRLAAHRRTPESLERLRIALRTQAEAASRGETIPARRAAADFHDIVLELAGNRLLHELGQTLGGRMRWLLAQHDDLELVAAEHRALCEAIAAQDAEAAAGLAAAHLMSSLEHLAPDAAAAVRARLAEHPDGSAS